MVGSFLIIGLPRSGTAWLSALLTCGSVFCQHEVSAFSKTVEDFVRSISSTGFNYSGNSDSGAVFILDQIVREVPDIRVVYVHRNTADCIKSFNKVSGIKRKVLESVFGEMLERISDFKKTHRVMTVEFSDLGSIHTARDIFAHVAPGVELIDAHWRKVSRMRIEQHPELIRNAASVAKDNVVTRALHERPDRHILAG